MTKVTQAVKLPQLTHALVFGTLRVGTCWNMSGVNRPTYTAYSRCFKCSYASARWHGGNASGLLILSQANWLGQSK